jgi:tetratricopeptide (TPR) repeat protein
VRYTKVLTVAIFSAAYLSTCGIPDPPASPSDDRPDERGLIGGQRATLREAPAGPLLHIFDRDPTKHPYVVIPRRDGAQHSLALETEDGRLIAAAGTVERIDELDIVRARFTDLPRASRMKLSLRDGAHTLQRWDVEFSSLEDDAPGVARAAALRREKKYLEALAAIEAELASPSSWIRTWAEVERGHIEYVMSRRDRALDWYRRAAGTAKSAGIMTEAVRRLLGVANISIVVEEYEQAEAAIVEALPLAAATGDPTFEAQTIYQHGVLKYYLGEYLSAADLLEYAMTTARRNGQLQIGFDAAQMLANARASMGSYTGALILFDEVPDERVKSTTLARHYTNYAEVLLAAMQAGARKANYQLVQVLLEKGLEIYRRDGTPQHQNQTIAWLARLAWVAGDRETLRGRLAELEGKPEDELGLVRHLVPLLAGELALADGDLDRAEKLAGDVVTTGANAKENAREAREHACMAVMLLGDIARARGRTKEAIEYYEGALKEVDRLAERLEVTRAKARFNSKHRRAAEALVELFVAQGQAERAFDVLMHAQSALLEDIQTIVRANFRPAEWRKYRSAKHEYSQAEKEDCALRAPADRARCEQQLAEKRRNVEEAEQALYGTAPRTRVEADHAGKLAKALAPGEAVLAVFRLDERWIAFYIDKKLEKPEISADVPRSWMTAARRLQHLYVIRGERTEEIEEAFQEGPGESAFAAEVPSSRIVSTVAFLDSGPRATGAPLIVGDSDSTLRMARTSAKELAKRLAGATVLLGKEATRAAVERRLSGTSVFHFSGHGRMVHDDPWTAQLQLADDRLGVAEILALRAELGLAVLEGCRTGLHGESDDFGLPQAMILSGTRTVIASVRDLEDGEAAAFLRRFYEAGGAEHPARAFRDAIRVSIRNSDSAWRAFRLWGAR